MRRASTEHLLGSKILSEHHHTQQVEATLFTDGLLRTPDLWESHSRRYVLALFPYIFAHNLFLPEPLQV